MGGSTLLLLFAGTGGYGPTSIRADMKPIGPSFGRAAMVENTPSRIVATMKPQGPSFGKTTMTPL